VTKEQIFYVVITKEPKVIVNSEELVGTTQHVTL